MINPVGIPVYPHPMAPVVSPHTTGPSGPQPRLCNVPLGANPLMMMNQFGQPIVSSPVMGPAPGAPSQIQRSPSASLGKENNITEKIGIESIYTKKNQTLESDTYSSKEHAKSWYYLGRIMAKLNKIQQAFTNYRYSIEKCEDSADTWCSIGVLYQKQDQKMDSLQAYLCSVQLNKFHESAWKNLSLLYESVSQYQDSLICLLNVIEILKPRVDAQALNHLTEQAEKLIRQKKAEFIADKLRFDEEGICPVDESKNIESQNQKNSLTPIDKAWSLPIPYELILRLKPMKFGFPKIPQNMQKHAAYKLLQSEIENMENEEKKDLEKYTTQDDREDGLPYWTFSKNHQKIYENLKNYDIYLTREQHHMTYLLEYLKDCDQAHKEDMKVQDKIESSEPDSKRIKLEKNIENIESKNESNLGQKAATVFDNLESALLPGICVEPKLTEKAPDYLKKTFDFTKATYSELKKLSDQGFIDLSIPPPRNQPILDQTLTQFNGNDENIDRNSEEFLNRMSPKTITITLNSAHECLSPALTAFANDPRVSHVVFRGLTHHLDIDLGLFSTKNLIEKCPDHRIEIRKQARQASEENWNEDGSAQVWNCYSSYQTSTVKEYGMYQISTLQRSLCYEDKSSNNKDKDGNGKKENSANNKKRTSKQGKRDFGSNTLGNLIDYDENMAPKAKENSHGEANQTELPDKMPNYLPIYNSSFPRKSTYIKFGTNVDLADQKVFAEELLELKKLPPFLRVHSPENMLSHIGYDIYGMNTVQLYMKIPGCRTPGHRENLNFPAVNLNIGPGDVEWYCVDQQYTGVMTEICKTKGLTFVKDSWWPDLNDLWKAGIPVHRFVQKPGDLVYLNVGTIHWVQSLGWCNNIAWNVGMINSYTYQGAVFQSEYNKIVKYKSIVAMEHLSWNLIRNLKINDVRFYKLVKAYLCRKLNETEKTIEKLNEAGIEVDLQIKMDFDAIQNCEYCEVELYNLVFAMKPDYEKILVKYPNLAQSLGGKEISDQVLQELYEQHIGDDDKELEVYCLKCAEIIQNGIAEGNYNQKNNNFDEVSNNNDSETIKSPEEFRKNLLDRATESSELKETKEARAKIDRTKISRVKIRKERMEKKSYKEHKFSKFMVIQMQRVNEMKELLDNFKIS